MDSTCYCYLTVFFMNEIYKRSVKKAYKWINKVYANVFGGFSFCIKETPDIVIHYIYRYSLFFICCMKRESTKPSSCFLLDIIQSLIEFFPMQVNLLDQNILFKGTNGEPNKILVSYISPSSILCLVRSWIWIFLRWTDIYFYICFLKQKRNRSCQT